jgi:uncharacterized protein (TIGR02453 family)
MPFDGFGSNALPFFKALAFHQSKEWFEENRATYERDVKTPLGDLIDDLAAAFVKAKLPLKGDRKSSIFRLHRDIRFSKDKSPYKTHAGAVLTRSGGKNDPGLLYIHISPEECFTAAGFYGPEPEELARLRRAIVRAPKPYARMVAALDKAGLELSDEYDVSRLPREFAEAADPIVVAALKRKSFICSRSIRPARLKSTALIDDLVAFAKDARPLLEWGWAAIVDER